MYAIQVRFLANRYHATPWDRQVNEGVVEWPPSPWRILRCLISNWYLKAQGEVGEGAMRELIETLSSPPCFHLPPATLGHTRHYMPEYRSTIDGKRTMVFDTFARIRREDPMYITWTDIDLDDDRRNALQSILSKVGYLGRAESWVEMEQVDEVPEVNCLPIGEEENTGEGWELVRRMGCQPPAAFSDWREVMLSDLMTNTLENKREKAKKKGKSPKGVELTKRDREKAKESLPETVFDALQADTSDLRKQGWSQPPGSTWIPYLRRDDAFKVEPSSEHGSTQGTLPTVARYALISKVPPKLTQALSVAERIHVSLVSRSNGMKVFSGKDNDGTPLDGHGHAHILPESNPGLGKGNKGEITHVTIHAPVGFDREARRALDGLTKVWGHGGNDLQLVLLGVGHEEDFGGLETEKGQCPILAESRFWVSRTPFVPTRHPKSTRAGRPKLDDSGLQVGSPAHDLIRLLRERGFPEPVSVEPTEGTFLYGHKVRWLEFDRERRKGDGRRASRLGHGFRIEFPHPVNGPLTVGYGAHFGLGQFVPEGPQERG